MKKLARVSHTASYLVQRWTRSASLNKKFGLEDQIGLCVLAALRENHP